MSIYVRRGSHEGHGPILLGVGERPGPVVAAVLANDPGKRRLHSSVANLYRLPNGVDVPGYALMFVAILFLGDINMTVIEILGKYFGRIFIEAELS